LRPAVAATEHAAPGDDVIRTPARRRFARLLLASLIVLHLGAFWLYALRERQSDHLQLFLGGRERFREGRLDEAARDYRAFVDRYADATSPFLLRRNYPAEASGWFALGRIETERGRVDDALVAYGRAMSLEPGRGRREYRDLLLETGRAAELAAFAERELAADAGSAVAWRDLGAARLALGEPAAATGAYRQALEHLPALLARLGVQPGQALTGEEADLVNLLSVAHLEAGERDAAQANCDALAQRQPRGAALDRLCRAYLLGAAGDAAGAAEQLRGFQPSAPEHDALVRRLRERLGLPEPERGQPYVDEPEA
jgi:tetratricopeptide (TPR) repeat protein